jgi:phosphohistidine phosphatase SixA
LKGLALVKALRQGGYVLYMRHAAATVGADQSLPSIPKWWENCAVQRNLSDLGRDQAKKVGEALRELAVPIAEVKSSQFCRNLETARLMGFKAITITEDINHPVGQRTGGPDVNAQRYTHLVQIPRPGTNTLLISHTQGSSRRNEMLMGQLQEAEIIVYLPDGAAEAEPLARIPVADWPLLVTLDWADKASRPQPSPSGRAPGKK